MVVTMISTLVIALSVVAMPAAFAMTPCPSECTEVAEALPQEFGLLNGLLASTGLDAAVPGFRGTIFAPTDAAITALVETVTPIRKDLGLMSDEKFNEALTNIVLYHLVPDNVVFSGAAGVRQVRMTSLFSDLHAMAKVCKKLGLGKPTNLVRLAKNAAFVRHASKATIAAADLEFCGPIVVHAVDEVLLPCEMPHP